MNRTEFLHVVKHSRVEDRGNLPDTSATRALLACQALRLVPQGYECPKCSTSFKLKFKSGHYKWFGPRYQQGCEECDSKEYSVNTLGFFRGTKTASWMSKLDCFLMWAYEYNRQTILRELHPLLHANVDGWLRMFQETLCGWFDIQTHSCFDSPLFQKLLATSSTTTRAPIRSSSSTKRPASSITSLKRPSSKRMPSKKPSASSAVWKKPSVAKKQLKNKHRGRVFIADETHLNKRKPSIISKHGRPQRDQIWLWGAVLEGHVGTHFLFRILDHPDDAYDGRPRGHKEMLRNINSLGIKKHDIFVSDKWKATVSAFKAFREASGLSEFDLPHEIVNHSLGELVNENGFSTNAIEAKWSVVKRWIRNKMSGKLPAHSDRQKWRLLIGEYQARNLLRALNPQYFDRRNIVTAAFTEIVKLFRVE